MICGTYVVELNIRPRWRKYPDSTTKGSNLKVINWLLHPAVQAGVLPFVVTLIIAITLFRRFPAIGGVAPMLAFFLAVIMTYGLADVSLLWLRKIVAVSLIVFFLGVLLDRMEMNPHLLRSILFGSGVVAAAWVFASELMDMMERDPSNTVLVAIMVTFYPAWMTWGLGEIRYRSAVVYTAITLLGVGTGIAAVFAKAEFAAELALAIGFASGAGVYLTVMARWSFPSGLTMTMPAGITLGLLGAAAFFYAKLSPISMVAFSLIPLVLMIQPQDAMATMRGYLMWTAMLLCIAAVAVFLAYVGVIRGYI